MKFVSRAWDTLSNTKFARNIFTANLILSDDTEVINSFKEVKNLQHGILLVRQKLT